MRKIRKSVIFIQTAMEKAKALERTVMNISLELFQSIIVWLAGTTNNTIQQYISVLHFQYYLFHVNLGTIFHILSSNVSSVITIKYKIKYIFYMAAMFFSSYTHSKCICASSNSLIKKCTF